MNLNRGQLIVMSCLLLALVLSGCIPTPKYEEVSVDERSSDLSYGYTKMPENITKLYFPDENVTCFKSIAAMGTGLSCLEGER